MRIAYHPAIAIELEEIREHYEACSTGLGSDLAARLLARPSRRLAAAADGNRFPADHMVLKNPDADARAPFPFTFALSRESLTKSAPPHEIVPHPDF